MPRLMSGQRHCERCPELIAAVIQYQRNTFAEGIFRNDRVSDLTRARRPDRNRVLGGIFVSAEIVQFIPRENRRSRQNDVATAFRPAIGPDDLTMDHVDTAPCEYVRPCKESQFADPGTRPDFL